MRPSVLVWKGKQWLLPVWEKAGANATRLKRTGPIVISAMDFLDKEFLIG